MYVYSNLKFMKNLALAFRKAKKVAWFVYSLLNLLTDLAFLKNIWPKFLKDFVTSDFRSQPTAQLKNQERPRKPVSVVISKMKKHGEF